MHKVTKLQGVLQRQLKRSTDRSSDRSTYLLIGLLMGLLSGLLTDLLSYQPIYSPIDRPGATNAHKLTTATNIQGSPRVMTRPAGRVKVSYKTHGLGRAGSEGVRNLTGRVGSGRGAHPTRPASFDPIREQPYKYPAARLPSDRCHYTIL